jgi:N-acyl amino acid synthase of PEP-CTERM/exosortase system
MLCRLAGPVPPSLGLDYACKKADAWDLKVWDLALLVVHAMSEMMKSFQRYFRVVSADTPELVQEACRLRYAVYCEEAKVPGFDKDAYPDGVEVDAEDERSVHSLLLHLPSNRYAGTVRLICAGRGERGALLPMEEVVGRGHFPHLLVGPDALPRESLAEVSRLTVAAEFRSRRGEHLRADGLTEGFALPQLRDRRCFPHTVLGLFVAVSWMGWRHGIEHLYAWMDPVLARLLARFGIEFQLLGPPVDYHGQRCPYFAPLSDIMAGMYSRRRDAWEVFTDGGRLGGPPPGCSAVPPVPCRD